MQRRARLSGAMMLAALTAALMTAACSSSSGGGGSRPSNPTYIVVPNGQTAVCADGTAPPCR